MLLVIEVADSSEAYDRDVKAPLYAQSKIAEGWLVRLIEGSICVCRRPEVGIC